MTHVRLVTDGIGMNLGFCGGNFALPKGLSAGQRVVDNEEADDNPVYKIVDDSGDNVASSQGPSRTMEAGGYST
jgi:hypothetical protein